MEKRSLARGFGPARPYNQSLSKHQVPEFRLFALFVERWRACRPDPSASSRTSSDRPKQGSLATMEKKYTARSADGLAQSISNILSGSRGTARDTAALRNTSSHFREKNPFASEPASFPTS